MPDVDINTGSPPLLAIQCGSEGSEALQMLLARPNLDVNVESHHGETALYTAENIITGDQNTSYNVLLDWVRNGLDVRITDEYRWKLLYGAAFWGNEEMVRELIARGADYNAQDNMGESVLHVALRCGRIQLVPILLQANANLHAADKTGWTILHAVAIVGSGVILQYILDHGAIVDLTAVDNRGWTTLFAAVAGCDAKCVEILLDRGLDPNFSSSIEVNPLWSAVRSNNFDVATLLLGHGANVLYKGPLGWTNLHEAAKQGLEKLCTLQLDRGADPNSKSILFGTPLTVAAEEQNSTVEVLVSCGANPTLKGMYGQTALDLCSIYDPNLKDFGHWKKKLYT